MTDLVTKLHDMLDHGQVVWSWSKLHHFFPAFGGCPRMGALSLVDPRPIVESRALLIGKAVAIAMAHMRWEISRERSGAEGAAMPTLELVDRAFVRARMDQDWDEETLEGVVEEAHSIICRAVNTLGQSVLVQRGDVFQERKIALGKDYELIPIMASDYQYWGTANQRRETAFRVRPDCIIWDRSSNTLTVIDDKALGFGGAEQYPREQIIWGLFGAIQYLQRADGLFDFPDNAKAVGTLICLGACQAHEVYRGTVAGVLQEWPVWIGTMMTKIRVASDYPAVECKSCEWCAYADTCPLMAEMRQDIAHTEPEHIGTIQTAEQAEAAAMWLWRADRCRDRAKKILDAWVQESGQPVVLQTVGQEYGSQVSVRREMSLERAAEVLRGVGLSPKADILPVMTMSGGDLDRVLKARWPMSGKGITADIKAVHRDARAAAEAAFDAEAKTTEVTSYRFRTATEGA